jgi:hypothetical protein
MTEYQTSPEIISSHPVGHHVHNETINALPGNDGVEKLEVEKDIYVHDHEKIDSSKNSEIGGRDSKPAYLMEEQQPTEDQDRPSRFSIFYAKYRIFFHFLIWAFFTAWWVTGLVLHRDLGWLIPFLVSLHSY